MTYVKKIFGGLLLATGILLVVAIPTLAVYKLILQAVLGLVTAFGGVYLINKKP